MTIRNTATYDNLLLLKDAGAVTASGAATVGGSARVLDLGPGRTQAKAIVDINALKSSVGDETYRFSVQGSNDITFGAGNVVELGSALLTAGNGPMAEVDFTTQPNDTPYRYVRGFFTAGGTAPSINTVIYIAKY